MTLSYMDVPDRCPHGVYADPVREGIACDKCEIERLQRELITARCAIISDVNQQRDLAEAKRLLRWLLDNMSDGWLPELHETDEWVKQAREVGGEHEPE